MLIDAHMPTTLGQSGLTALRSLAHFQEVRLSPVEVRFEAQPHPTAAFPHGTISHILAHFSRSHPIHEFLHLAPSTEEPGEKRLAERLMYAYLRMHDYETSKLKPAERPNSGIWEMTKHEFHGHFHKLIAQRDLDGLALYLRNAMREPLTHGLGPGRQVFDAMNAPGDGRHANVLILIDRLASLAEAVGALPYENPEQGRYGVAVTLSATDLVDRIEAAISAKIGRSAVMGNFGLLINGSIIDVRVPDDVYTILRAKTIADTFGLYRVAEIGGGLGGNAVQAARMGFKTYTIFDLPVLNVVQGWFLIKQLKDAVRLFGEADIGQTIYVAPYWEFYRRDIPFDLVINRDSLPEIPREHAEHYLAQIAERRSYFLSINQEGQGETGEPGTPQLWVFDLIRKAKSMRCISRHPPWIRRGYVEELFAPL